MSKQLSKKELQEKIQLQQDINYAKNLAASKDKLRNKSLKYLKKYLHQGSEAEAFTELNLCILWKGLFTSMWMSDKPLIQEECAENIAKLIHNLRVEDAANYLKAGLETLKNEWFGIDQHRINKFMMLARRLLRQAFVVLKNHEFDKKINKLFIEAINSTVLNVKSSSSLGLYMHFTEIYLEELAKVADGKLSKKIIIQFIQPYVDVLIHARDPRIVEWIEKFVFTYLMQQHKLGLEYTEKYNVWRNYRFEGTIDQVEKVTEEDDDDMEESPSDTDSTSSPENKPLDPRAGRVNVELPQINFEPSSICNALVPLVRNKKILKSTRNVIATWVQRFQKLQKGIYPLAIKKVRSDINKDTRVRTAAKRLMNFEESLYDKEDKKTKKARKKDVINMEEILIGEVNKDEERLLKKLKRKMEENVGEETKPKKRKNRNKQHEEIEQEEKEATSDASPKETKIKKEERLRRNSIENKKKRLKNKLKNVEKKPSLTKVSKSSELSRISRKEKNEEIRVHNKENKIAHDTPKSANEQINTENSNNREEKSGKPKTSSVNNNRGKFNSNNDVKEESNTHKKLKIKGKRQLMSSTKSATRSHINETTIVNQENEKKVSINTKLNISQDIHDHILQVKSSPQIPYDGNKKPRKSMLKYSSRGRLINPFYKLSHSLRF